MRSSSEKLLVIAVILALGVFVLYRPGYANFANKNVVMAGWPSAGGRTLAERLKLAEDTVEQLGRVEEQRQRLAKVQVDSESLLGTDQGWRSDLKIFVYDLPSDFNTNLLDPAVPRYYSCRDSMYAAEIMIHEQLLTSPFRTLDPKEANLFFVPIYTSCFRAVRVHVNSRKLKDRDGTVLRGRGTTVEEDMFHFVYSALDYISQEFPYWNQQQGRDHILTFAHDFGACFTYHQEETYKIERLQIQQALHNAILLQYLGDLKSTCFHSHKDIVIPPVVTNKHLLALKGGEKSKPIADRKTGVYFRGKIQFDGGATRPGYSRGVRAQLNSTYHSDPFFSINEGHSPSYIDELTDSKMCLAPPGYALWTPRLTEAILVGCIPLVIGDDVELPFEGLVDYRSLAVRVHEKDTGSLANIVKGISDDALEKKRSNVRHVWQRYRYNNPSQRGDAFDSIMQLLAQKVRGRDRPVGNDAFI